MSNPTVEQTPRVFSEPEMADRLLRVGWNAASRTSARGVKVLPAEFVAEQGRAVQIIDVRERDELTGSHGHIPGSIWVPLSEVERITRDVLEDSLLVMVCDDGNRSHEAALQLTALGMTWVAALEGGVRAWRDRGYEAVRDGSILERTRVMAATVPAVMRKGPLALNDIQEHIGEPRTVRWAKMAGFLLHGKTSCVDGRDDHGVVGTPGGDAGEFVLALAAVEQVTGKPLDESLIRALLRSYVDAFGHFYLHSDVNALNRLIAAMRADARIDERLLPLRSDSPQVWRKFTASVPKEIRSFVLEHLLNPDHIGCGHLRFMLTQSEAYGVRQGLVATFLRTFFDERWQGLSELEFVPLGGGHREGAVVNIELDESVMPYSRIPLASPNAFGMQMFVNHPGVTAYQRKLAAHFLSRNPELSLGADRADALLAAMTSLGAQGAGATLSRLAKGLPVFHVKFDAARSFRVEPGGVI